jgi:hypothetical protein
MTLNCSTAFRTRLLGRESFNDIMGNGAIRIFTGDAAEQGTLLGVVSVNGQPFTPGSPSWGIPWVQIGTYMIPQEGLLLAFQPLASGIAGWFRVVGNAPDDGTMSLTVPRMDGSIATLPATAEMSWTDATVAFGQSYPLTSILFALPPL